VGNGEGGRTDVVGLDGVAALGGREVDARLDHFEHVGPPDVEIALPGPVWQL
jgi:hypothetical protein